MENGRSRKSKLVAGVVLLVVGLGLLIWTLTSKGAEAPSSETTNPSGSSSRQQQDTVENPDQAVSNDNQAETAEIVFNENGFSPEELEVKVGTVVTVRNNSSTRVQFSSDDHPTHRINQGMNLRILRPGESGAFTAEKVGEWGFHDHIDASHTGVVTVVE